MTSYEFEVAAKNAVIEDIKENFNEEVKIQQVQLVWFSKTLKNMKAIVITITPDQRIFEITYNGTKNEMYVDCYNKIFNKKHTKFNTKVAL